MMFQELLKNRCESDYASKYSQYEIVKQNLIKKLNIIPVYFPHFSLHNVTHSKNIIESAEKLIGKGNAEELSLSDVLFLLLSAYAHDVGMSISYQVLEELVVSDEWQKKLRVISGGPQVDMKEFADLLLHYPEIVKEDRNKDSIRIYQAYQNIIETVFRDGHAERSAAFISEEEYFRDLLGIRLTKQLADICEHHEQDIEQVLQLPFEENGLFSDYLHPRFIASMLCFCDLLDMDTDRFDETILKAVSRLPRLSETHKKKHESLKHFLIRDGTVEIKSDCETDEVYRTMRCWTDWMKKASQLMVYHWDEICPYKDIAAPKIRQCEILLAGGTKWSDMADVRLSVDGRHAMDIFSGTNIYEGKHAFLREIIQNSIDATLVQFGRDVKERLGKMQSEILSQKEAIKFIREHFPDDETSDNVFSDVEEWQKWTSNDDLFKEYAITGKVSLENGTVKVEITDHGIGIRDADIKRIANLQGKSEALKKEIATLPDFLHPAGAFSLGLQTVFQVADKVEFYTKTNTERAKHIIIEGYQNGNGYVSVKDMEDDMLRGTRTVVCLDNTLFSQTDLNASDFMFATVPKEKLILGWLIHRCSNNLSWYQTPAVKTKLQTRDYFPVEIEGDIGEDRIPVIKRKSCLADVAQDEPKTVFRGGKYSFHHVDIEAGIIFDGEFILPKVKDGRFDGKLDYDNRLINNSGIWYRNVFAVEDYDHYISYQGDKFPRILNYRINIISGRADEILNISRDKILSSYHNRLEQQVLSESRNMRHKVIDDVIEADLSTNDTKASEEEKSRILTGFLLSLDDIYRTNELAKKYKAVLTRLTVGNYYSEDGTGRFLSPMYLAGNEITLLKRIDDSHGLVKGLYVDKLEEDIKDCIFATKNDGGKHFLNHYLIHEGIIKVNDKFYFEYLLSTQRPKPGFCIDRSEAFILENLINILCGNYRVLCPVKGYEDLVTEVASGVEYPYPSPHEMAIEMSIDESIKADLCQELMKNGYVKNAKNRYATKIKRCEMVDKNIDFIEKSVAHSGRQHKPIQEKYESLIDYCLELISKKSYAAFIKYQTSVSSRLEWLRLKGSIENGFSQYIVD